MKGVTPCSCLFELLSADVPVFSAFVVGLCFLTAEEVRARDKLTAPDITLTTHLLAIWKGKQCIRAHRIQIPHYPRQRQRPKRSLTPQGSRRGTHTNEM